MSEPVNNTVSNPISNPISNPVYISASQIETFDGDCNRKWYHQRILKLPVPPKGYFTFGIILHGCLERWMAATENGRVPMVDPEGSDLDLVVWPDGPLKGQCFGDAVNVYPVGWETTIEDGKAVSVTPNEARLIKRLVAEAIEKGIVQRIPGQAIERELRVEIMDGVVLVGFMDLQRPGQVPEIHDHKSYSKSGSRYLKQPGPRDDGGNLVPITAPHEKGDGTSPNCVGHNQQLLTYAWASSKIDGHEGSVLVRHNQFPKYDEPKGVRFVEALVSAERIAQHGEHIAAVAQEMLRVRAIKRWEDVPGPRPGDDACNRYGGCPYRSICGHQETPEVYKQRVEKQLTQSATTRPNIPLLTTKRNKDTSMNIFNKARAMKGTPDSGATATAEPPKTAAAPKPPSASKTVDAAVTNGAPWANPNCPACKGLGIVKAGTACKICDSIAKKAGRPNSISYEISHGDETGYIAIAKESAVQALEAAGQPTTWIQNGEQVEQPNTAPEVQPDQPDAQLRKEPSEDGKPAKAQPEAKPEAKPQALRIEPEADGEEDEESEADEARPKSTQGKGRPKLGFTLLVGAAQIRGPKRNTTTIQEILAWAGAELAADMGAANYYELDPFKRRERLKQKIDYIVERIGNTIIMVPGVRDPDIDSLVSALISHPKANMVIEGLR